MAADPELTKALALHKAGDVVAAGAAYREILRARESPEALTNLATLMRAQGEFDVALNLLARAVWAAPDSGAVRRNLGNLHMDTGRVQAAVVAYKAALHLDPADDLAAVALAHALLALGRFKEAWPLFERRPELALAQRRLSTPKPRWRGEPLDGKRLLIWPEQGFGDQIMMLRYVRRLAGETTIVCQPQLARLMAQLPAKVLPLAPRVLLPEHDYWTVPMSLAGHVAGDLPTEPYLRGVATQEGAVGVAWLGNARPDPARSLPPELGAQLLSLPGAVSLHPEDSGAEDFQDTADLIAGLDLVVTIDTSVAHLAGAMGKPTLVLLHGRSSDWRWRTDENGRSVWYPSAQVLRQPASGDWTSVLDEVKARWPC